MGRNHNSTTNDHLLSDFATYMTAERCASATRTVPLYLADLRQFIKWLHGRAPLADVSSRTIQRYLAGLFEHGAKPRSVAQ